MSGGWGKPGKAGEAGGAGGAFASLWAAQPGPPPCPATPAGFSKGGRSHTAEVAVGRKWSTSQPVPFSCLPTAAPPYELWDNQIIAFVEVEQSSLTPPCDPHNSCH